MLCLSGGAALLGPLRQWLSYPHVFFVVAACALLVVVLLVFVDVERSHFNFLAVTNAATTRNLVRLATDQHVPTNGVGGSVQWSKATGRGNLFSAGGDWRWVDGDSEEDAFVAAVPSIRGGVERRGVHEEGHAST